uniref:Uncharacterized protein n=1 Tax=Eutreptiella gymnastica TaxID=73025 RepID=A0A7S4CH24_9EUGL
MKRTDLFPFGLGLSPLHCSPERALCLYSVAAPTKPVLLTGQLSGCAHTPARTLTFGGCHTCCQCSVCTGVRCRTGGGYERSGTSFPLGALSGQGRGLLPEGVVCQVSYPPEEGHWARWMIGSRGFQAASRSSPSLEAATLDMSLGSLVLSPPMCRI